MREHGRRNRQVQRSAAFLKPVDDFPVKTMLCGYPQCIVYSFFGCREGNQSLIGQSFGELVVPILELSVFPLRFRE